VITHNAPIADMADRVLRLADGRIVDARANAHKVAASTLKW
jgi:putative ABC transport system ATP-binding protein